jgi:hypothetical protein
LVFEAIAIGVNEVRQLDGESELVRLVFQFPATSAKGHGEIAIPSLGFQSKMLTIQAHGIATHGA